MNLELQEEMLELLKSEYERKSTGLAPTSNRDNISIDADRCSEICTEEEKINEIKEYRGRLLKAKTHPLNRVDVDVISIDIAKESDFKKLAENKKKTSMVHLYHTGAQKYSGVASARQNHSRVKSFVSSECKKSEYKKRHHSHAKKSYVEQAIGDLGVPTITFTPILSPDITNVANRNNDPSKQNRKKCKFLQCLSSKNYSTELVRRDGIVRAMQKKSEKAKPARNPDKQFSPI
eukprot:TRINITY_DN1539_c0_g1_i16.p2 TRINITY_DN1539_c0_g1~~TRINITY_DN1539_c0_g1_i16.p2  ORF type:complete len:234 (-),score=54.74 TRINITY_DN1539_c0_g1_i16:103-804(-)